MGNSIYRVTDIVIYQCKYIMSLIDSCLDLIAIKIGTSNIDNECMYRKSFRKVMSNREAKTKRNGLSCGNSDTRSR